MGRLLVLVVLAYLVSLWLRSAVRRLRSPSPQALGPEENTAEPAEELSRCAFCGVYVPQSRALRALTGGPDGQGVYCSETCRQKAS